VVDYTTGGQLSDKQAAGFGGYKTGDPVDAKELEKIAGYQPVLDLEHMTLPPSWKHRATPVWRASGEADYRV
jgi:hypothetical protein